MDDEYSKLEDEKNERAYEDLVRKGVLVLMGEGRGAFYNMPKKRLINGSNGSWWGGPS